MREPAVRDRADIEKELSDSLVHDCPAATAQTANARIVLDPQI